MISKAICSPQRCTLPLAIGNNQHPAAVVIYKKGYSWAFAEFANSMQSTLRQSSPARFRAARPKTQGWLPPLVSGMVTITYLPAASITATEIVA